MIRFHVPGRPMPQGSKSFKGIRGGRAIMVESSKDLGPWRERIALVAHQTMRQCRLDATLSAVSVHLVFLMPRPKSLSSTAQPAAIKRPDIDKLARAVLDALTAIVFHDDSQVVDLRATKRLALPDEQPGVNVEVCW